LIAELRECAVRQRHEALGILAPSPVLLLGADAFMAMASVSCASLLIDPYDMAPV